MNHPAEWGDGCVGSGVWKAGKFAGTPGVLRDTQVAGERGVLGWRGLVGLGHAGTLPMMERGGECE